MKTKKLFTLCLLAFLGNMAVHAYDIDQNGIYYNITDADAQTVEVTYVEDGEGNADFYYGNVTIPKRFSKDGTIYTVTAIGIHAFNHCSHMTSVTIPESVTSIGRGGFEYCSGLTSVTIPEGVTTIDPHAFRGCSSLASVTIPENVTSIGDYTFHNCSGLTSVTIGNNVTSIGELAFYGCSGLTSVIIPEGVTSIGQGAFRNCSGLTSVTIPEGVTIINDTAFEGCSGLTSVTIPSSVTNINMSAFSGCSSLTSVTIPNSVTTIRRGAFGNSGLTSVFIPSSVTAIGVSAFSSCSDLTSIIVEEGNSEYDSRNDCNAIIEKTSNTLISGCKNTVIPNSVTSIGSSAFEGCSGLTSVTIPNSVSSIGSAAFESCTSLTSVDFPNSVTTIDSYAFRYCSGLTSLGIPNSVTNIGAYAFLECNNLITVKVDIDSPLAIDENTFTNRTNATLYVPAGCKDAYEDADYWTEFNEIVEMPGVGYEFTTAVPCNDETANLTFKVTSTRPWEVEVSASPEDITGALTIPATVQNEDGIEFAVKSIGKHAFDGWERENAHSMTSVTIAEGITTIDNWAFQNCPELETVILPESVENIYGAAFAYSPKLSAINIPTRLKTIYDWLFTNCTALKSIDLPEGITEIKNDAFKGSGLESIKFPSTLTSVGESAFSYSNLSNIDFNGCSATFDNGAFSNCKSLEQVYIPNTVSINGIQVFNWCESLKKVEFQEGYDCSAHTTFWHCTNLEEVILPTTKVFGWVGWFLECPNIKTVTFLDVCEDEGIWQVWHYNQQFDLADPTSCRFIIPEGKAELFLRKGYMNLSDLSGLPFVRREFEAEAERIATMAEALSDGDKTTLNDAINAARTTVNAAEDYLTVFAQIDAIKTAAKSYLTTATLPEEFDVTAAAITNPDIENYAIGWKLSMSMINVGYKEDSYSNGDIRIDNFVEVWGDDGSVVQTIPKLPAGIYRLEADIIAANKDDASVEVTGVSLFAGNQSTPVATENEKPQHFSVKFENSRTMDVTIGINSSNTNANWVAMDNVRLIYEGKAASLPQGAELVSSETDTLYLYNVDADKYLSAGHSCGTHAILDETGLPLRLTKNEETGLWQIYFWEGSLSQKLLFQEYKDENPNTYVDYNDNGNPWWSITQVSDGTLLIQNEASAADKYLGNDPSKQDLQGNYNGVSFTDVNATVSADKNIHWLLFSKAACDMIIAKRKLMDAILRMEKAGMADIATLLNTANSVYENDEATLKEVIDITTLLNSQMGMPKTDEPVDMTALIINPRFENNTTEGWTGANVVGGRSDATSNQEQEFFEKDFNMYQVITGVPNGRYMLKWKGFHRPGNKADVAVEYASGTDNASAVVYGNEVQKTMKHIASEMSDTKFDDGDFEYGGKYFPDGMESVRKYFDAGFYADELEVEVTDNVLTIGVKNTQPMSGEHWVIFSDFELYIMENEEQLYHKLTADNVKCVPGCLTTFNVNLLNRDDVTAFQFDVELPEGVSIYEENGQKEAELTNRGNGHMFQCIKTGENTYQFSALSLASKSFKKNEGPIVRMTLTTDGSKELGDYPIKVKNTELSKPNGMMVLPFDFTSTLTIKAADPGDVNGDGKITVTDAVYVFKYVNGETPEHFQMRAADVNNSNSITINDAVQIVNMILGNGQTMSSRAAKKLLRQLAREY